MSDWVPAALRSLTIDRARGRCEHIIARKHQGETIVENLAWSCAVCNGFKGSDIASIDPETGRIVRLFNPRTDEWDKHFELRGAMIVPLTAEGRVTEYLLKFNLPRLVQARQELILQGRYPR